MSLHLWAHYGAIAAPAPAAAAVAAAVAARCTRDLERRAWGWNSVTQCNLLNTAGNS